MIRDSRTSCDGSAFLNKYKGVRVSTLITSLALTEVYHIALAHARAFARRAATGRRAVTARCTSPTVRKGDMLNVDHVAGAPRDFVTSVWEK